MQLKDPVITIKASAATRKYGHAMIGYTLLVFENQRVLRITAMSNEQKVLW